MDTQPYLILAVLWIIYFMLHSLLATDFVKQYFSKLSGKSFKYYRLWYTLFSLITLLPVLYYNALISSKKLIPANALEIAKFAGMVLATYGVIVIRLAFRHYSIREFLGLKRAANTENNSLQTIGILQYVRHPLYAGAILIFSGFWFFSPTLANLITVIMVIIYILVGIRLEEAKLIKTYGQQYEAYKKKVPMLIPSLQRKKQG